MNIIPDIRFVVNTDGTIDIYAKKGATWDFPIFMKNEDGSAMDLTGWSARGQVRKLPNSTAITASFSCTVTPATGRIDAVMAASVTTGIKCGDAVSDDESLYYYDFERYQGDPEVVRKDLPCGKLYVVPEVTRDV